MNDSQLLERLAATDAYAPGAPLPSSARTRHTAIAEIERRTDMQTQTETVPPVPPSRARNGWLAAAAAFVVVLVLGAVMVFLAAQGNEDVVEPTTTTSATPTTITTVPPPPEPAPLMVDAWQRVGGTLMDPVVGTFAMTDVGSRLIVVGFDPGEDNYRQNGVIFASDDGLTWERLAEDDPALNLGAVLMYGVTDGGPGLVAVGMGCEDEAEGCAPYATVWTSVDGSSWTRSPYDAAVFGDTSMQTSAMIGVIDTSHGLVAVGSMEHWTLDAEGVEELVTIHPTVWTSADGTTWERSWEGVGVAVLPDDYAEVDVSMFSVAEDPDGQLVAVGSTLDEDGESVAAVWTSADGQEWERIDEATAVFSPGTVMIDLTWGEHGFVAVGTEGGTEAAIWQSSDGRSWIRIDTADQPFDTIGSLSSVAALDSGYTTVGPHPFIDDRGGWVTLWTSPDGLEWDRVHAIGEGYTSTVVVVEGGIAVAGGMSGADNFHAAVWVGPLFDPEAPPPDPEPPPPGLRGSDSALDPTTVDPADVGPGFSVETPSGDEYASLDSDPSRVVLEERTAAPDSPRLDFLAGLCDESGCFRDATVIDPDNNEMGSGVWVADTPFHIRQGFINDTGIPLSEDFNVIVYATRRAGPELSGGVFEIDQTYRLDAGYLLTGATSKCGPGYWEQAGTYECDWIVYELSEGLPQGRYDIWAGWYAPCSAWLDLGIVEACDVPTEVTSQFESSVNMPLYGDDYTEGAPPPYDADTIFAHAGPITRGQPSD